MRPDIDTLDPSTRPQPLQTELQALRAVLDSAGCYIYTKDAAGRYTYANPLACELFGLPLQAILGHRDSDFFDPTISGVLRQLDDQVLRTGQPLETHNDQVTLRNGREVAFWSIKTPMRDPQGHICGLCHVSFDVSELQRAKAELTESSELLETVLRHVDAYIYLKDDNGRYLYANPKVERLLGRRMADIVGHTDVEIRDTQVSRDLMQHDRLVFHNGQPLTHEESFVDDDGVERHFWSKKHLLHRPGKPACLIGFTSEVTELKAAQHAMQRSEARFRTLFEATSEAVIVIDPQRMLDCNAAAVKLFGATDKAALCALRPHELSPARQPCGTPSLVLESEHMLRATREGHLRFEWTHRRLDTGIDFPCEVTLSALQLEGEPVLIATVRDFTERKRYEEQIHHLAFYDALTQLPNRRLLYDRLHHALAQSQRNGHQGAVIFLDLDNFKPLNDRHGHDAGDLLLQEVAQRIGGCLRASDTVARLGGDEFVVLLSDLDASTAQAEAQALNVAEKIRQEIARPYHLAVKQEDGPSQRVEHHCAASLGVALFPAPGCGADDIMRRADDAMYQAKADGRDCVRLSSAV